MPKGIYKRVKPAWSKGLTKETDERLKKNSETRKKRLKEGILVHPMKGKKQSEESKRKMSESSKGCISWCKGIRGEEFKKHYPNGLNKSKIGKKLSKRELCDEYGVISLLQPL